MGFLKFYVGPDYTSFYAILEKTIQELPDNFKVVHIACDTDNGLALSQALTTSFLFDNNKLLVVDLTGVSESNALNFLKASDLFCIAFAEKLPTKVISILKNSGAYVSVPAVSLNNLLSKISFLAESMDIKLDVECKKFIISRGSLDLYKIYNALLQCKIGNIQSPTVGHLKILLNSLESSPSPWDVLKHTCNDPTFLEGFTINKDEVFGYMGFFSKTLQQAINIKILAQEYKCSLDESCDMLSIPSWQSTQPKFLANLPDKSFNTILDSYNEFLLNVYVEDSEYRLTNFLATVQMQIFKKT